MLINWHQREAEAGAGGDRVKGAGLGAQDVFVAFQNQWQSSIDNKWKLERKVAGVGGGHIERELRDSSMMEPAYSAHS